jgi:predicted nucleic acid-binding protein
MMFVYLDTCSHGRPYDDTQQVKVAKEKTAVWSIRRFVRQRKITLVWSFALDREVLAVPIPHVRDAILAWKQRADVFVPYSTAIENTALTIMSTGVKQLDALHVAAAIHAHCQLFITTDKRLQRYANPNIYICDPVEALEIIQELHNTL